MSSNESFNTFYDTVIEPLYKQQKELENQSIEITVERYQKALSDMEKRGRAGETKPVILLISRSTQQLSKSIEDWIYPSTKERGWNAGRKATTRSIFKSLDITLFTFPSKAIVGLL